MNPFLSTWKEVRASVTQAELVNGLVKSADLIKEDHGMLTFLVDLQGPGWGQGFGTYNLQGYRGVRGKGFVIGSSLGCTMLLCLLDVFNAWSLIKLAGAPCRVYRTHSQVVAIGDFLEDRWFCPGLMCKKFEELVK